MTRRMLYPEQRNMDDEEILSWAKDMWNDAAPKRRCPRCGTVTVAEAFGEVPAGITVEPGEFRASDQSNPCRCVGHSEPLYPEGMEPPEGVDEACEFLADLGVVTFACKGFADEGR